MTRSKKFCQLLSPFTIGATLFMTIVTVAGNTHAQVAVTAVTSPSLDATQESSLAKQIAEYAEQAKRWADTLKQYQQFISTITGLSIQSLLPQQPLQKLDENKLAEQACPGAGNMVTDVLSAVTGIDLNGSVIQNAQRLCVMTTKLKVKMYNDSVDQANRLSIYDSGLKRMVNLIDSLGGSGSSNGNTQRLILETNQASTKLQTETTNYEINMKAYKTLLETLQNQQSILAQASLKGKASVLGTVTQAGAFAAAFR